MGIAGPEKGTDPRGFLIGLADGIQVGTDDFLHAFSVLSFAHECGEFASQFFERFFVVAINDPRLPLIDQWESTGIALENVFDLHGAVPSPCKLMGTAK